jgi:hypothetical protein
MARQFLKSVVELYELCELDCPLLGLGLLPQKRPNAGTPLEIQQL